MPSTSPRVGRFSGPLAGPFAGKFIGIDVGEDYLDLAIVSKPARSLIFHRVALAGIGSSACAAVAERVGRVIPGSERDAIAMVDSPRWPCDLDWSRGTQIRVPQSRGRELDGRLREMYSALLARPGLTRARGLSMFPTPRHQYFLRCARDPRCKPHLSAISAELFGTLADEDGTGGLAPGGGAIFTRFMLAGFASYRALERLGITAFESYPDLQLRLCAPSASLPPKSSRAEALAVRGRIVASLAARLGFRNAPVPANLDQADAAVLALAGAACAENGALWVIGNSQEGRFLLALDERQSRRAAVFSNGGSDQARSRF